MIENKIDPSKTHIISFSGGMGSAISALAAYENSLKFELVFADTLIEDPDLYRFISDVAESVGKKIWWLKDGRTPWEVFVDKRFIGNSRTAHCSQVLKTEKVRAWIATHCSKSMPLVLGMGLFEYERIERARLNWNPREVVSLLIAYNIPVTSYKSYLDRYGIKIPRLYEMGFPHNNCGGMCVRSGQRQHITLLEKLPDVYAKNEAAMEHTMAKIGPTAKPYLKIMRQGVTEYVTMKQFRELYEAGEINVSAYTEDTSCACFVDD